MEYVASVAGAVGALAAILACLWAHKALVASREANRIAKESNEIARHSFAIDKQESDVRVLEALKERRFKEFWPLVQALSGYKVPSTTEALAQEWSTSLRDAANNARLAWKNLDPRHPPDRLPPTLEEVKVTCNEFFQRAGWRLIP